MKLSYAICALAFMGTITIAACSFRQSDYPPLIEAEKIVTRPAPEQKLWALSLAAILVDRNGGRLDLLGGSERTLETIAEDRELLADWWSIGSREDLLASLKWIERGGHRKGFDDLVRKLDADPNQVTALTNSDDVVLRNRATIVLKYRKGLAGKSIVGWDFGRYIALCGWGYVAGYLSEDEAWQKIMPVARKMQTVFNSWDDFGTDYMIGRQYWSPEQTKSESGKSVGRAYMRLMFNKDSPWVVLPWNLSLVGKTKGNATPPIRP